MKFEEAFKMMKSGGKAKLPSWGGYWYWNPEKKYQGDPGGRIYGRKYSLG